MILKFRETHIENMEKRSRAHSQSPEETGDEQQEVIVVSPKREGERGGGGREREGGRGGEERRRGEGEGREADLPLTLRHSFSCRSCCNRRLSSSSTRSPTTLTSPSLPWRTLTSEVQATLIVTLLHAMLYRGTPLKGHP